MVPDTFFYLEAGDRKEKWRRTDFACGRIEKLKRGWGTRNG